ncbi:hypothetical protein R1sor_007363 [Riccia sorocarpa]|uniref:Reverse transcriptase domain-containing protein n=1 Tax=Riccia sorocarpa TaxID=122646 RepID=A0ABD3HT61_9MARC
MDLRVEEGMDSNTLTQLLFQTAREVFPQIGQENLTWFDAKCKEARKHAMEGTEGDRHAAFRSYKNLVKGEKRRFIREHQHRLAEELKLHPQKFWSQLQPPKVLPELAKTDLMEYVAKLYFVPEVDQIPPSSGRVCSFRREEVELALNGMRMGAARDLNGVSMKLLRWGGEKLLSCITEGCNLACRHGFPAEYTPRRSGVYVKRAFDSVSRKQIWERLHDIGVPEDLVNAEAVLYQLVNLKATQMDEGISSNHGVIQGCSVSLTLFGLIIDQLFSLNGLTADDNDGFFVPLLMFADDVVLLARTEADMNRQIQNLESFCQLSGLDVNLTKTRWMRLGPPPAHAFSFRNQSIEECSVYKYLGLEVSSDLRWTECLKSRLTNGLRAL